MRRSRAVTAAVSHLPTTLLTGWADFTAVDATVQAMILGEVDTWVARPFGRADEEFHTVLTASLARWTHEHDRAGVALTIVGDPWDSAAGELRDGFARLLLPFAFRDAQSGEGKALLVAAGIEGPLPVVILDDGRALARPGLSDIAAALGVQESVGEGRVDVAVIGGGPAGLAAAVYGASEGLTVTVIEFDEHRRPGELEPDAPELSRFPGRRHRCRADRPGAPAGHHVRREVRVRPHRDRPPA